MLRSLGLLLALVGVAASARADSFVDILSHDLWARKGGLACDTPDGAADGGSGLFSGCVRLPYAVRVEIANPPEPDDKVYSMRFIGVGDQPVTAWFDRASLTNTPPRPGDLGPTR